MKLDHKKVAEGKYNGETVWITDLRYRDLNDKPIRNLPPTQVLIRSNEETNKNICYSESHFVPIGRKGKPLKKVIPLFDNTGYRSYQGSPLEIYTTEEEANNAYAVLADKVANEMDEHKRRMSAFFDNKIADLRDISKNLRA